jgi:hypothetical protein
MATTEHTINDALARVLIETRSLWRFSGVVKSENIDVLKSSGKLGASKLTSGTPYGGRLRARTGGNPGRGMPVYGY